MSLHIKNEETHARRRLAALTGQSQTGTVDDAVRRRLESLERHDGTNAELVGDRVRDRMSAADRERLAHAQEDLYDEAGLPQ